MNATIKIRAVNGYIEPQRFDRLTNENLQLKATYIGGFKFKLKPPSVW